MKKRKKLDLFEIINYGILTFLTVVTLYPFLYVLSMSVSLPDAVMTNKVWLWPVGFSLKSYGMIFASKDVLVYYYNSLWYAVVGTLGTLVLTMTAAYPLSRRNFALRTPYIVMMTVTMFFSGGLIPFFILINQLGLYNTRWAIVLPSMIGAWNIIITRIYINESIDDNLIDAARIDGYNDFAILLRIIAPLSMPILAFLALGSAVGFWNSYFSAMIFLRDKTLQPIQLFLVRVIIQNSPEIAQMGGAVSTFEMYKYAVSIKYAVVIMTIAPIIAVYPFLQKYFVKGIMIGAIK